MARREGVRKDVRPLGPGPWLTDPSGVRLGGRLALVGVVLFVGLALLLPQASSWAGWIIFGMATAALGGGSGATLVLVSWLAQRSLQYCPECLQSMARGAYVCPYCGFRETPRKERP
jgi:hypothetical protein